MYTVEKAEKKIAEQREAALRELLSVLPRQLAIKLRSLSATRRDFLASVSEIRVRQGELSSLIVSGENFPIHVNLDERDIALTYEAITKGEVYLHTEAARLGYISLPSGVRVGLVGDFSAEGGRVIGISRVRSLIFRLPFLDIGIGRAIRELILTDKIPRSCVIYTPPGGGKTTALRSTALALCEARYMRIAMIDERGELTPSLFLDTGVDILSGCSKANGIEIATRVLNPELIMLDELSGEAEARSLYGVIRAGVPIIATVHADSSTDLHRREGIAELLRRGAFKLAVGIKKTDAGYIPEALEVVSCD